MDTKEIQAAYAADNGPCAAVCHEAAEIIADLLDTIEARDKELEAERETVKPHWWMPIYISLPEDGQRVVSLGIPDGQTEYTTAEFTYIEAVGFSSNIVAWIPVPQALTQKGAQSDE